MLSKKTFATPSLPGFSPVSFLNFFFSFYFYFTFKLIIHFTLIFVHYVKVRIYVFFLSVWVSPFLFYKKIGR